MRNVVWLLFLGHVRYVPFSTCLKHCYHFSSICQGRIHVIEFIVERMHQEKVQPDSSTCQYVFSAYVDQGFHSTAVEALQVLSLRMLSEEDGTEHEKTQFEDDFILAEDSEAESRILQLFKNSEENVAVALLNLRWCAILGFSTCWSPDQSPWAIRLARNYDTRKGNWCEWDVFGSILT